MFRARGGVSGLIRRYPAATVLGALTLGLLTARCCLSARS
jgi:hypothetical protein